MSQALDDWLKKISGKNPTVEDNENGIAKVLTENSTIPSSDGRTCRACHLVFDSIEVQHCHFKTELHVVNLKRSIRGLDPLLKLEGVGSGCTAEQLGINLADTDSEVFEEEGDDRGCDGDAEANEDLYEDEDGNSSEFNSSGRLGTCEKTFSSQDGPSYTFRRLGEQKWEFALSSSIFLESCSPPFDPWSSLAATAREVMEQQTMWAVLILRSGRLAAAIFQGQTVLIHKAFRRYTVRAKAGGSQSSHDNQGSKAMSVGAMLRRYGEQSLKEDTQTLLRAWAGHLQTCSRILVSIPKTLRHVIYEDSRDPPLRKGDPRIKSIPFMVGTPTFEEAKRVHEKCSSVVFRQQRFEMGADIDKTVNLFGTTGEEIIAPLEKMQVAEKDLSGKKGCSQEVANLLECIPSKLLLEACASGRATRVREVLQWLQVLSVDDSTEEPTNGFTAEDDRDVAGDDGDAEVDDGLPVSLKSSSHAGRSPTEPQQWEDATFSAQTSEADALTRQSMLLIPLSSIDRSEWDSVAVLNMPDSIELLRSPLHLAAEAGHAVVVSLLLRSGGDPCRPDVRDRTPYAVAKNKATRDAFRRARGDDEARQEGPRWDWTSAGVPSALTDELEKAQKEKEKEKKKRAKLKKKSQKEREDEEKRDREQAIAREEAMKAQDAISRRESALNSAGACGMCSKSLYGVKSLEVLGNKFCCAPCVLSYRRKVAAEAALQRMTTKKP